MIIGALIVGGIIVASLGSITLGALQHTPADFDHYEVDRGDMTWVEQ